MSIAVSDIIPFTQARANLSALKGVLSLNLTTRSIVYQTNSIYQIERMVPGIGRAPERVHPVILGDVTLLEHALQHARPMQSACASCIIRKVIWMNLRNVCLDVLSLRTFELNNTPR